MVIGRADITEFDRAVVEIFDEIFVVILRGGRRGERRPVKRAIHHRWRGAVRNVDAEDFDFHCGEAVFESFDLLLNAVFFVFREAGFDEAARGYWTDGGIPRGELNDVRKFGEEIHRAIRDFGAVEIDLLEFSERGEFGHILIGGAGFLETEFLEVGEARDNRKCRFGDFGFSGIEHDDVRLDRFEAGDEFVGVFGIRSDEDI